MENTPLAERIAALEKEAEANTAVEPAYTVGKIYMHALNEPEHAAKWLKKAYDAGSPDAGYDLALCSLACHHYKGPEVLEELHKKGYVRATAMLGVCYRDGLECVFDEKLAKKLLKEAADKGDEFAAMELKKESRRKG